ncbi:MAG TPA: hypothetical protein VFN35_18755 [Ktedonobacteraceae bacterium]|nr:hypothetical protein [Ktedonobacteraceae bacterium]
MDITVVQYVGFVVAALIVIWAVIEVNKRLYRRDDSHASSPEKWAELDTKVPEAREDLSSAMYGDSEDDEIETELHARASQNGHHAESQKPQL